MYVLETIHETRCWRNKRNEYKLLESGADQFVTKPFDLDEFPNILKAWADAKTLKVMLRQEAVETRKEKPVDAKHARELKALAERDLCKMTLKGRNVTLIVHKNVPNKISHDFIEKELEISTFLDRNSELPGECHLYKSSGMVPIVHFEEDLYNEKVTKEDEEMKQYSELVLRRKDLS